MKRVCVFCGSSPGSEPVYLEAARRLGRTLARRGLGLVYGGGSVGLMGAIADAVLAEGGEAVGVIPRALQLRELAHGGLTTLHVVGSMHERKAKMAELAHAFVALPGGMGRLEELTGTITWSMLGLHAKPVGLLKGLYHTRQRGLLFNYSQRALFIGFIEGFMVDRAFNFFLQVYEWIECSERRPQSSRIFAYW